MFDTISCFISEDKIEVNGKLFTVGDLSEDFLNTSREEFLELDALRENIEALSGSYDKAFELGVEIQSLRRKLLRYKLFRALEAQPQPAELEKFELPVWESEYWAARKAEFESNDAAGDFHALARVGNQYRQIVHDIYAFNTAMFGFIDRFVEHLDKMDKDNYAEAFYKFSTDGYMKEHRGIPAHEERIFPVSDPLAVQYVPRPKPDGKGYAICECYHVKKLQSFLKLDFYRALMTGHVIRRCKNCKKFFLLTKGFHTLYCDRPIPGREHRNCRNQGAKNIAKMNTDNNPVLRLYQSAYNRVHSDYNRGNITAEERDRARVRLRDLRDEAISGKHRDAEVEALMQSAALYESLGIKRK